MHATAAAADSDPSATAGRAADANAVLLERLRGGSDEAFAEAFQRHGRLVHSACRRLLVNAAAADEATQAVFILLMRQAPRLPTACDLGGWCYRAAVYTARAQRRAEQRRAEHERTAAAAGAPPPEPPPNEALAALDEALADLRDTLRRPLVMIYLEGCDRIDAARRLGLADTALRRRLSDGLAALRHAFARRGIRMPERGVAEALALAAGMPMPPPALLAQALAYGRAPIEALPPGLRVLLARRRPLHPVRLVAAAAALSLLIAAIACWPHPREVGASTQAGAAPAAAPAARPAAAASVPLLPDGPPTMLGSLQQAQPHGGQAVLWARSRWHNYCLATYDFTRGLRGDHPDVRNAVQLVFGNAARAADAGGPPRIDGYPGSPGNGACGEDGDPGTGRDAFRVGLHGGDACRILALGRRDIASLAAAPAMDHAGDYADVVVGASYVIRIHEPEQPVEAVAFTVLAWRADDAVLIDWRPIAPPPGDPLPPMAPQGLQ